MKVVTFRISNRSLSRARAMRGRRADDAGTSGNVFLIARDRERGTRARARARESARDDSRESSRDADASASRACDGETNANARTTMTTTMTNANALTSRETREEDARGRLRRWAESDALRRVGEVQGRLSPDRIPFITQASSSMLY